MILEKKEHDKSWVRCFKGVGGWRTISLVDDGVGQVYNFYVPCVRNVLPVRVHTTRKGTLKKACIFSFRAGYLFTGSGVYFYRYVVHHDGRRKVE